MTKRWGHSLSVWNVLPTVVLVVQFGGYKLLSGKLSDPTMIELSKHCLFILVILYTPTHIINTCKLTVYITNLSYNSILLLVLQGQILCLERKGVIYHA